MTTPSRERTAKRLLKHEQDQTKNSNMKKLMQEKQREFGWNDHFTVNTGVDGCHGKNSMPRRHVDLIEPIKPRKEDMIHVRKNRPCPRKTPPLGRLQPIPAPPIAPPVESKSDHLKTKVDASIEYRETLRRQLREFLECFPLKYPPHGGTSPLSKGKGPALRTHPQVTSNLKPKEINGILKQMSTELQVAGVRCVEAIVAWMLHFGKRATSPPVYLWRGSNYLVQMYTDLDFIPDMINSRGLALAPEFTRMNPLLIESNQRLGRVCAAHSIIVEMVEMTRKNLETRPTSSTRKAKQPTSQRTKRPPSGRIAPIEHKPVLQENPIAESDNGSALELLQQEPEDMTTCPREFAEESQHDDHQDILDTPSLIEDTSMPDEMVDTTRDDQENQCENDEEPSPQEELNPVIDDNQAASDEHIEDEEINQVDDIANNEILEHEELQSEDEHGWKFELSKVISNSTVERIEKWIDVDSQGEDLFHAIETHQKEDQIKVFQIISSFVQGCNRLENVVISIIDTLIEPIYTGLLHFDDGNSEMTFETILNEIKELVLKISLQKYQNLACIAYQFTSMKIESIMTCKLFQFIYPHLVNLHRQEVSDSCHQLFTCLSPAINYFECPYLLNSLGKGILLLASCGLDEKRNSRYMKKGNFICDRLNPLTSSIDSIQENIGWIDLVDIYPCYASEYGEKQILGRSVEAGEGRGPLKEWFSIVSKALCSSWGQTIQSNAQHPDIELRNRTLHGNDIAEIFDIKPGYQFEAVVRDSRFLATIVRVIDSHTIEVDGNGDQLDESISGGNYSWRLPQVPLLQYIRESESYWLHDATTKTSNETLHFFGWFLAMAIYHQVTIDCTIHVVMFNLLLGGSFDLESIRLLDNSLYDSWMSLKTMTNFESFLEMEELPTTMTCDEYILHAVGEKAKCVEWQIEAIRDGFTKFLPLLELTRCKFNGADLQKLLCGESTTSDFKIQEIFRICMDDDFKDCNQLHDAFWDVVEGFSIQTKRKFIKFVTGVDKLPVAGTEFMRIEMPYTPVGDEEKSRQLYLLPQSHTCDNILELPNYWLGLKQKYNGNKPPVDELRQLISTKIIYAIENGDGYDLDATKSISITPQLTKNIQEESTESLQLVALGDALHSSRSNTSLLSVRSIPCLEETSSSKSTHDNTDQVDKSNDGIADEAATSPNDAPNHDEDEYSFDDFEEV